jgi:hypothetical protein
LNVVTVLSVSHPVSCVSPDLPADATLKRRQMSATHGKSCSPEQIGDGCRTVSMAHD